MRTLALFLILASRRAGSAWRRWLLSRAYPGITFGTGVTIARGVMMRVTDGGTLVVGDRTAICANVQIIVHSGRMEIGADGFVGAGAVLACDQSLSIGRDALIAEYVTVRDHDHRTDSGAPYRTQGATTAPVAIGDNVWLGAKATVLKGVTIGDGAVAGAGAVITRDVAAGTTVVGVPARPL